MSSPVCIFSHEKLIMCQFAFFSHENENLMVSQIYRLCLMFAGVLGNSNVSSSVEIKSCASRISFVYLELPWMKPQYSLLLLSIINAPISALNTRKRALDAYCRQGDLIKCLIVTANSIQLSKQPFQSSWQPQIFLIYFSVLELL